MMIAPPNEVADTGVTMTVTKMPSTVTCPEYDPLLNVRSAPSNTICVEDADTLTVNVNEVQTSADGIGTLDVVTQDAFVNSASEMVYVPEFGTTPVLDCPAGCDDVPVLPVLPAFPVLSVSFVSVVVPTVPVLLLEVDELPVPVSDAGRLSARSDNRWRGGIFNFITIAY